MKSVLFVCTGNTCRSPMAEALLRDRLAKLGVSDVTVGSAGLYAYAGDPPTPEAVQVLGELGLDHAGHRSRPLTGELLAGADLVLTMESRHKQEILRRCPETAGKVFTLKEFAGQGGEEAEVADPLRYIYDPQHDALAGYRQTRQELSEAIEVALPRLLAFLGLPVGKGEDQA